MTSLNAWQAPADQTNPSARDAALRDFLIRLRDLWRRDFPEVPRLGRSDDLDQEKGIDKDLAEVLSMDGQSSNYSMRNLMGRHYLEHLWVFLSADNLFGRLGGRRGGAATGAGTSRGRGASAGLDAEGKNRLDPRRTAGKAGVHPGA